MKKSLQAALTADQVISEFAHAVNYYCNELVRQGKQIKSLRAELQMLRSRLDASLEVKASEK